MNSFVPAVLLMALLGFAGLAGAQDVSGNLSAPQILRSYEPNYSSEALTAARLGGTIHLFVEVDRTGYVYNVEGFGPWITCGVTDPRVEELRDTAISAARKTLFLPARRGDIPVEGAVIMTYNIELQKTEPAPSKPPAPNPPTIDAEKKLVGGVVNGHAISLPKPSYPAKGRRLKLAYTVVIRALIDEQGNIVSASAISGHPLLMGAAAEAACRAKFTPTTLAGQPVKVSGNISYNFVP